MKGFDICENSGNCDHKLESVPGLLGPQKMTVMIGKLIGGGVCIQNERHHGIRRKL